MLYSVVLVIYFAWGIVHAYVEPFQALHKSYCRLKSAIYIRRIGCYSSSEKDAYRIRVFEFAHSGIVVEITHYFSEKIYVFCESSQPGYRPSDNNHSTRWHKRARVRYRGGIVCVSTCVSLSSWIFILVHRFPRYPCERHLYVSVYVCKVPNSLRLTD